MFLPAVFVVFSNGGVMSLGLNILLDAEWNGWELASPHSGGEDDGQMTYLNVM